MTEIVEFINGFTSKLLESVKNRVAEMSVFEIIINLFDIIIMTALFFAIYKFIKKRRAGKLAVGLILIVLATFLSSFMGMKGIQFILSTFYQVGMIAIIIVFQPELRAALEKVGGNPLVAGIKSIGMDSKDAAFVISLIFSSFNIGHLLKSQELRIVSFSLHTIQNKYTTFNSPFQYKCSKNTLFPHHFP